MKKQLKKVIALLSLVLLLAACSGNDNKGSTTKTGLIYPAYAPAVYTYYPNSKDVTKEMKELARELDEVMSYSTYDCSSDACAFERLNTQLDTQIIDGFSLAEGEDHLLTVGLHKGNEAIQGTIKVKIVKDLPGETTTALIAPSYFDFIPTGSESDDLKNLEEQLQQIVILQEVIIDGDDHDTHFDREQKATIDLSQANFSEESFKVTATLDTHTAEITIYTQRDLSQPLTEGN